MSDETKAVGSLAGRPPANFRRWRERQRERGAVATLRLAKRLQEHLETAPIDSFWLRAFAELADRFNFPRQVEQSGVPKATLSLEYREWESTYCNPDLQGSTLKLLDRLVEQHRERHPVVEGATPTERPALPAAQQDAEPAPPRIEEAAEAAPVPLRGPTDEELERREQPRRLLQSRF